MTTAAKPRELDRLDSEPPHPYTAALASKVRHVMLSAWWEVPVTERDVADILSEAFHQIARDIRAGQRVAIEDIGTFERVGLNQPWVIYRATPELLTSGGVS